MKLKKIRGRFTLKLLPLTLMEVGAKKAILLGVMVGRNSMAQQNASPQNPNHVGKSDYFHTTQKVSTPLPHRLLPLMSIQLFASNVSLGGRPGPDLNRAGPLVLLTQERSNL